MVTSNNRQASELTINLLKQNNCKKVIQIIGGKKPLNPQNDYPTFCKELASNEEIEIFQVKLEPDSFSNFQYEKTALKIFDEYGDFDAIIGVDLSILACEKIAISKNIEIPKKLKLIAYDGTYVTQLGSENITSIHQPIEALAKKSVEILIDLIDKKEINKFLEVLDVSLTKGNTTY